MPTVKLPRDPDTPIRAAIAQLASLRIAKSRAAPDLKEIEASVHALVVTGGDAKRRHTPSAAQIAKELEEVCTHAARLHSALAKMSVPAATRFRDPGQLKMTVRTIEIIAGAPDEAFPASPPRTENLKPDVALALDAASVFWLITGRRPGRSVVTGKARGPFYEFVAAVFEARGMKASPENAARAALRLLPKIATANGKGMEKSP